jgi:hypothetical protein
MTDKENITALTQALHPGVRYLALTRLQRRPPDAPAAHTARAAIPAHSPVKEILAAQYPAGYWMHPGPGISPRYRATVWQVLFLAQLGTGRLPPVERAVDVLLAQNRDTQGAFRLQREGGASAALTAALLWALERLDFSGDERLARSWAWLAARPDATFADPVAVVWTLRAAAVAGRHRLRERLVTLLRPFPDRHGAALSDALTFPLALQPDRLALLEAGVAAGLPLPEKARAWLEGKRGRRGFWPLERVPGRLWWDPGEIGGDNPWVTLRALYVLTAEP